MNNTLGVVLFSLYEMLCPKDHFVIQAYTRSETLKYSSFKGIRDCSICVFICPEPHLASSQLSLYLMKRLKQSFG